YNESNSSCKAKINASVAEGLTVIYCVGETLEERNSGNHFQVVSEQINALADISEASFKQIIIAYEPVWAIGTGVTASAEQANEMHIHIRKELAKIAGDSIAQSTSILYGGSVKPDNAASLFAMSDIDGALIGGASLKSRDFIDIAKSFSL